MKERKRANRLGSKKKGSETAVKSRILGRASSFLRSHDIFGQFVTISYSGSQTYTTSFGGFLSLLFKLFMMIYLTTQVRTMIEKSNWSLSQQIISAPKAALKVQYNLGDYSNSNISIGIQMKPKMKDIKDRDALEADGRKLQRYMNIFGMFEKYKD